MTKDFDYEGARKAGYSEKEISEVLSKAHPAFDFKAAEESGYDESQINKFLSTHNPNSRVSKIRSAISAPIKGLIKGIEEQKDIFAPFISGLNTSPISKKFEQEQMDKNLPVRPEHEFLERAGRLAPIVAVGGESIPAKLAQLAFGTAAGESAKIAGAGETGQNIAEGVGTIVPGLAKAAFQGAKQLAVGIKNLIKTPVDQTKSGLTKLAAVEAKGSRFATLSPERHAKVIENLDKEAAQLAQRSIERNVPIAKELQQGVDVENRLKTGFTNLRVAAEKANPDINTKPVTTLFKESLDKYRGIPNPHGEAIKVLKEISSFRQNPARDLGSLLKTYRSNNNKLKSIFETSQLKGSQKEYSEFLVNVNKSIVESIENTLPADSVWLKEFKDLNQDYRNLRNAEKTIGQLKGILSERPTSTQIEKLVSDQRTQDRLSMAMGKKGAAEVVDIAKDLKEAKLSLKKIPKSELSKFDAVFPLYYAIPYIGKYLGTGKFVQVARYSYGWLLSTPSRRNAYKALLDSFVKQDIEGYKKASLVLKRELGLPNSLSKDKD